jgi:hypothetical protein
MSTELQEQQEMGTKPQAEHEWLKKLVGDWRVESEMIMEPGAEPMKSTGRETVKLLGGLWSFGEGEGTMPDGNKMEYKTGLGYDVSFKEYRGFWIADVSSHMWKYTGELSADGRVMTLSCVGPHMEKDGETANYRDVIEFIDDNHRTLTSYGEGENGEWTQFQKSHYTRM